MLSNLNVILSFELNVMVKVKVGNSVDGTGKVKRLPVVVEEYGRNSIAIFFIVTPCPVASEGQDTGITLLV